MGRPTVLLLGIACLLLIAGLAAIRYEPPVYEAEGEITTIGGTSDRVRDFPTTQEIGEQLRAVIEEQVWAATRPSTLPVTRPTTAPSPAFSELVERAEAYARQKHPGIKYDFTRPARVIRYEDYWEVTWIITTPRMAGGMPVVRLDRKTLDVISADFYE